MKIYVLMSESWHYYKAFRTREEAEAHAINEEYLSYTIVEDEI